MPCVHCMLVCLHWSAHLLVHCEDKSLPFISGLYVACHYNLQCLRNRIRLHGLSLFVAQE